MTIEKLFFATTNEKKLEEVESVLALPIEKADLHIIEIQSLDLAEIARHKVMQAYEAVKKPIIVDDVGLYLAAWNGFPGPFIKYMLDSLGHIGILRLMAGESNRAVILKAAIGFHDGKQAHTFIGEVEGKLVREPRGTRGWGFDPLIIPEGSDKTLAEMPSQKKFSVSHRGKALAKLKVFLNL